MALDSIAGVAARMAQIQVRITALETGTAAPAARTGPGSFATAYADAVAARGAAPTTTAAGGRVTADGIPAELAAYGNGKIPAAALRAVGDTGHRLWAPAASGLTSLIAAARRDGVTIGITDSYRSYAEQVDLVKRKGLYSQGGLAAKPGTSDHGWGLAVDLKLDAKAQAWMRANGSRFGFVEDTPREPWHWKYTPAGG